MTDSRLDPAGVDSRGIDRTARPTRQSAPRDPLAPEIVQLDELPAVICPCGVARRAFVERDEFPGTVHLTTITADARTHYHKQHTEVYVVLECDRDAQIELDGRLHRVEPKTSVLIPPGVRHRAIGCMSVLIVCHPNFDPEDEFFD